MICSCGNTIGLFCAQCEKVPAMLSIQSGECSVYTLMRGADVLLDGVEWCPKGMGTESNVNLVEAKAMLIYLKKKLKQISDREGYDVP